ncbi:MAG: hypothetical protein QM775_14380 [Pirellulales bacterium]
MEQRLAPGRISLRLNFVDKLHDLFGRELQARPADAAGFEQSIDERLIGLCGTTCRTDGQLGNVGRQLRRRNRRS